MDEIPDQSVQLVVTSPPYPMIEMWDGLFEQQSPGVADALKAKDRLGAYEAMHRVLDSVWNEVYRVLAPGCFACINIGDATRTIDGHFMLYPNHARILTHMISLGFTPLPEIIWRKQSNAPNKFMGSGMLPAGAYVTQEHEYILILRKGGKREFKGAEPKKQRQESAFFWEERNCLFSDVWTGLLGTRQTLDDKEVRKRSAAYPFELPHRLITMYSLKEDTVLDPFFGMGTTMLAAMAAGRNSIGYEISQGFDEVIKARTKDIIAISKEKIYTRLENHVAFVKDQLEKGRKFKYINGHYLFPVITNQEKNLLINEPETLREKNAQCFEMSYGHSAPEHALDLWKDRSVDLENARKASVKKKSPSQQLELF